jgi:hypothetical protein
MASWPPGDAFTPTCRGVVLLLGPGATPGNVTTSSLRLHLGLPLPPQRSLTSVVTSSACIAAPASHGPPPGTSPRSREPGVTPAMCHQHPTLRIESHEHNLAGVKRVPHPSASIDLRDWPCTHPNHRSPGSHPPDSPLYHHHFTSHNSELTTKTTIRRLMDAFQTNPPPGPPMISSGVPQGCLFPCE